MGVAEGAENYLKGAVLSEAAAPAVEELLAKAREVGSTMLVLVVYAGDDQPHVASQQLARMGEYATLAALMGAAESDCGVGLVAS